MLVASLACAPVSALAGDAPALTLEHLAACVAPSLNLEPAEAWLVARRLEWSTGGPRCLVGGVGAALRSIDHAPRGAFTVSDGLPDGALLAVYRGLTLAGSWRRVEDSPVTICGTRLTAYTSGDRLACLVQSARVPAPRTLMLKG